MRLRAKHFNPQGPRGPRRFSIRPFRRSSDFNPQGPRGPRLYEASDNPTFKRISIHKALAGLDLRRPSTMFHLTYFNPQGPRGPRLGSPSSFESFSIFQSTRPSRASTNGKGGNGHMAVFQSTRPSRASTNEVAKNTERLKFQSTRPSRASTAIFTNFFQFFFIFLFIMLHFSHSTFLSHPKIPIFYTTFPAFSSANIQAFPCPIHIRTKKSTVLLHQIQALLLYAPPYFYIGSPDNKISGCLYLYQ